MTPSQFKQWRTSRGWDQAQAAAELKVSIHTVRSWEQGKNPIPGLVEKHVLNQADLKVPVSDVAEVIQVASDRNVSFDEALALVLRTGLRSLRPVITQTPKKGRSEAKGKKP